MSTFRGDVSFEADGKVYRLNLGVLAMRAIEERTGSPFGEFFNRNRPQGWGIDDLITLFGAGLTRHHADMTESAVVDIIDIVGIAKVSDIITRAVAAANGEAATGGDANPPKQRRGTGKR